MVSRQCLFLTAAQTPHALHGLGPPLRFSAGSKPMASHHLLPTAPRAHTSITIIIHLRPTRIVQVPAILAVVPQRLAAAKAKPAALWMHLVRIHPARGPRRQFVTGEPEILPVTPSVEPPAAQV